MAKTRNGNFNFVTVSGILLIVLCVAWAGFHLHLLYSYHFTERLFPVIVPDWLLYLNIFMGVTGLMLGILILKYRIQVGKAYLITATLFTCARFLEFLVSI